MPVDTIVFSSSRHAQDVKALKADIAMLIRKLVEVTEDRNEWRTQHENLLVIYQAEMAKKHAA